MGDPHDSFGAWAVNSMVLIDNGFVEPRSRPVPIALDGATWLSVCWDDCVQMNVLLAFIIVNRVTIIGDGLWSFGYRKKIGCLNWKYPIIAVSIIFHRLVSYINHGIRCWVNWLFWSVPMGVQRMLIQWPDHASFLSFVLAHIRWNCIVDTIDG